MTLSIYYPLTILTYHAINLFWLAEKDKIFLGKLLDTNNLCINWSSTKRPGFGYRKVLLVETMFTWSL